MHLHGFGGGVGGPGGPRIIENPSISMHFHFTVNLIGGARVDPDSLEIQKISKRLHGFGGGVGNPGGPRIIENLQIRYILIVWAMGWGSAAAPRFIENM